MTFFKGKIFTSYTVCACGAVTVYDEDENCYSSKDRGLLPNLEEMEQMRGTCNCNHCVNHWGLDLCGCGSGEKFGECEEEEPECKLPMQDIEEARVSVAAGGAWV